MFRKNKKRISTTWRSEVEPDEIFLDSKNLPKFDTQQFEGRIERPIPKITILSLGLFFILIGIIILGRLSFLQIIKGEAYFNLGENNSLSITPIFSDMGVIYDRYQTELVWNDLSQRSQLFPGRFYTNLVGFSNLLGYVSYPTKDKAGFYWQEDIIGKSGLENYYNEILKGTNGSKILETNVLGETQSESIINPPIHGNNIFLTIDSQIQEKLFELIANFSEDYSFTGGAGIIMDINNGELIALVSFPEYDSEVLSKGSDQEKINQYLQDDKKPFLFRGVTGAYTPGSIIKPFLALGALNEEIINPSKKILSTGSISIPNPYFPDQESVFKDWKAHGWVDMKQALAVSSNVYFYEIGGGFENQKGLGISNIEKYLQLFGFGEETKIDFPGEISGTIPTPEWKKLNFNGDSWRLGDTYHTAIGQYGLQVTPLQMARATAILANNGVLIYPHLLLKNNDVALDSVLQNRESSTQLLIMSRKSQGNKEIENLNIKEEYFKTVKEGMRQAVTTGTANSLNISGVKVAAKTGTAQLGSAKKYVNSWVIGFFPDDNPKYSFTVLMENGPEYYSTTASHVMRDLLNWMTINTPEYLE